MPLRLLLYISEVYQNIIEHKTILHQKLVKIPAPRFIVLYNGKEQYPDRKELKLSEAFKDIENLKLTESNGISLELTARVYNINYGRNSEILKKSATLDGYSIFIEKIREYNKEFPIEESIKMAVEYCIKNDILKQFMNSHRLEVVNMLLEEITIEDEIEVAKEDAREQGREIGLEQGREIGLEQGLEQGKEQERQRFLKLLNQGLSIEEIKERLLKF
jgi:hypothetical protein